jgi:hypothetical protein
MARVATNYIDINVYTDKQFSTVLKAFEFSDEVVIVHHNDSLYIKKPDEAFSKVTDSWTEWHVGGPSAQELEEFGSKTRREILKWFFEHTSSALVEMLTRNSQFEAFTETLPIKFPSFYSDGETIAVSEEVFYPISEGGIQSKLIQRDLSLLKSVCPKDRFEIPIGPFSPYKMVLLNKEWRLKRRDRYVKGLNNLKDIINYLRDR